ncbi:MAG: glycosyltransferase family 2 protein [Aliarcobacter skirrowii]|uniref:glycosyltransferase family 2 protein n=1 Tax=Aliarcobacter skirrowii TaxID=28200 RepID=UPI00242CADA9|nr:glycosyltransferase family 2 protein [Aliarcobacter skirrowii]MDD2509147.1 glycosyltransferase family 2 protein [Aliarcobacter skirrowii]MDD3496518.1 glycosyltransferase family 2 protein [Aliarcobacter skirrowii]
MNNINVSVILTVYNTEQYLDECLYSIVNQSLKNIEIIIVNDGSTDTSLEIINKFSNTDQRIKILNQKNMLESMYLQAQINEVDVLICPYRINSR